MFTNPFVQSQQMLETWTRMTQEQLVRMHQMSADVQKLQGQAVERTRAAIDETARLMKEALGYAQNLGAEWHKITLDTAQKAAESAVPKA
jgi:hypothetical protein